MNKKILTLLSVAALTLGLTVDADAEVKAQVRVNGNPQIQTFNVRWMGAKKKYVLASEGGAEREYNADDVQLVRVIEPGKWKDLKPQVQKNNSAAISQAMKIADEYKMLLWDAEIGATVARAQLSANKVKDAIGTCQKIISGNPNAAFDSVLAPVYWDALVKDNQKDKLEPLLKKGVTSQIPLVAASASLRNGELLFDKGDTRGSLRDGFLRVVVLFTERDIGPNLYAEGLYRAGKAFEKLGETTNRQRVVDELTTRFSGTEWGKRQTEGK